MPKVSYVRAGKDYPSQGIKKGEMHYTWAFFRQKPQRSRTQPTRSQLTQSEHLSQLYELIDTALPACDSTAALYSLADDLETLKDEIESAKENLPENFQNAEQGERYDNRASDIETFIDKIYEKIDEIGEDEDDFNKSKKAESGHESYADAVAAAVEELQGSAPDPE